MKRNIVLVGFMGAGKTVTGEALAARLGAQLISTDQCIVEREGRSINDIFAQEGEKYFRDVETEVIEGLSGKENLVIDCGGGVVLKKENVDALKKNGTVVFLKTSPEVVYDRVKHDTQRPLLNVADPLQKIKELLDQRAQYYAQANCDVLTDGKTADEVAEEIIKIVSSI